MERKKEDFSSLSCLTDMFRNSNPRGIAGGWLHYLPRYSFNWSRDWAHKRHGAENIISKGISLRKNAPYTVTKKYERDQ